MNEERKISFPSHWAASGLISLLVCTAAIGVQWGTLGQRISTLEKNRESDVRDQREFESRTNQDIRLLDEKNATHDTKIAVIDDKLDTIITQLTAISSQLRQTNSPVVLPPKSTANN